MFLVSNIQCVIETFLGRTASRRALMWIIHNDLGIERGTSTFNLDAGEVYPVLQKFFSEEDVDQAYELLRSAALRGERLYEPIEPITKE